MRLWQSFTKILKVYGRETLISKEAWEKTAEIIVWDGERLCG